MRLTLLRTEARHIRPLLQEQLRHGVWFTQRRRWLLWVTFTISGPPQAVEDLRRLLQRRGDQEWWNGAW